MMQRATPIFGPRKPFHNLMMSSCSLKSEIATSHIAQVVSSGPMRGQKLDDLQVAVLASVCHWCCARLVYFIHTEATQLKQQGDTASMAMHSCSMHRASFDRLKSEA